MATEETKMKINYIFLIILTGSGVMLLVPMSFILETCMQPPDIVPEVCGEDIMNYVIWFGMGVTALHIIIGIFIIDDIIKLKAKQLS